MVLIWKRCVGILVIGVICLSSWVYADTISSGGPCPTLGMNFGALCYRTDNNNLYLYTSSAGPLSWTQVLTLPPGGVLSLINPLITVTSTGSTTTRSVQDRFADIYNIKDYGADNTGVNDSHNAIVAAQNAAAVSCGIVFYPGGTYKNLSAITVLPCVTHKGVGWSLTKDLLYQEASGTQLVGNGTDAMFVYNPTDGAGQYATLAIMLAAQISGVVIKDIAISNVTHGVKLGARYVTGAFFSRFENLLINQSSGWGFYCENCSYLRMLNIMVSNVATNAIGGIYLGASTYGGGVWQYNHGNHYTTGNSVFTLPYGTRGIVYQARDGASLNQADSYWLGAGMQASGVQQQVATMANLSANIGVTDSTKYLLDMPVSFSVNANGFNQYQSYFVVSSAANVIQVANQQRGTAIAATGNAAVNVFSYGFPGLEVSAFTDINANAVIQGTTLSGISIDGQATTMLHVQNAYVYLDTDFIAQGQGIGGGKVQASSVTFRVIQGGTFRAGHPIVVDSDHSDLGFLTTGFHTVATNPKSIVQKPPIGVWNDAATGWVLNLQDGHNGKNATFRAMFGNNFSEMWTYPDTALGQRTGFRADTNLAMDAQVAGAITYTGAGSTTWTLPPCTNAAGGVGNGVTGMVFFVTNGSTGGAVLTLAANAGNNFNRQAAKTSYSLAASTTLGVIGQWDGSACFWQVLSNNGAT